MRYGFGPSIPIELERQQREREQRERYEQLMNFLGSGMQPSQPMALPDAGRLHVLEKDAGVQPAQCIREAQGDAGQIAVRDQHPQERGATRLRAARYGEASPPSR